MPARTEDERDLRNELATRQRRVSPMPVSLTFSLTIETDNAAFEDREAELTRILRKAADLVEAGETESRLYDMNGNRVGSMRYLETERA